MQERPDELPNPRPPETPYTPEPGPDPGRPETPGIPPDPSPATPPDECPPTERLAGSGEPIDPDNGHE